eukprot:gene9156-10744_t
MTPRLLEKLKVDNVSLCIDFGCMDERIRQPTFFNRLSVAMSRLSITEQPNILMSIQSLEITPITLYLLSHIKTLVSVTFDPVTYSRDHTEALCTILSRHIDTLEHVEVLGHVYQRHIPTIHRFISLLPNVLRVTESKDLMPEMPLNDLVAKYPMYKEHLPLLLYDPERVKEYFRSDDSHSIKRISMDLDYDYEDDVSITTDRVVFTFPAYISPSITSLSFINKVHDDDQGERSLDASQLNAPHLVHLSLPKSDSSQLVHYYQLAKVLERHPNLQSLSLYIDTDVNPIAIYDPFSPKSLPVIIPVVFKGQNERDQGNQAFKAKELDKALELYDMAYKLDTNDVLSLNNKTAVYMEQKRYQQAMEHCQIALDRANEINSPDYIKAKVYSRMMDIQTKLGMIDESMTSYGLALKHDYGLRTTLIQSLMAHLRSMIQSVFDAIVLL